MLEIIYKGKGYNIPKGSNAHIDIDAYAQENKQLKAELDRITKIADERICDSCGEKHPIISMCPPHEVRLHGINKLVETVKQLQDELNTSKQEGDTMWEGLNGKIAELQAEIKDLKEAANMCVALCPVTDDTKEILKLQAELDKLKKSKCTKENCPHAGFWKG